MHTGGGLLRHTAPILHDLVPAIGILTLNFEQQILDDLLFLVCRFCFRPIAAFFQFVAFMNEQCCVATIIDYELRAFAFGVRDRAIRAPPVVLKRFAFPREHSDAAFGNGRGSMVLRGKNIAASPAHARSKIGKCLDQHRGLNRHVQRSSDAHVCQRFLRHIFLADRHQPGHFLFRDRNFFATKVGQ